MIARSDPQSAPIGRVVATELKPATPHQFTPAPPIKPPDPARGRTKAGLAGSVPAQASELSLLRSYTRLGDEPPASADNSAAAPKQAAAPDFVS